MTTPNPSGSNQLSEDTRFRGGDVGRQESADGPRTRQHPRLAKVPSSGRPRVHCPGGQCVPELGGCPQVPPQCIPKLGGRPRIQVEGREATRRSSQPNDLRARNRRCVGLQRRSTVLLMEPVNPERLSPRFLVEGQANQARRRRRPARPARPKRATAPGAGTAIMMLWPDCHVSPAVSLPWKPAENAMSYSPVPAKVVN